MKSCRTGAGESSNEDQKVGSEGIGTLCMAGRNVKWCSHLGNRMAVPQKLKNELSCPEPALEVMCDPALPAGCPRTRRTRTPKRQSQVQGNTIPPSTHGGKLVQTPHKVFSGPGARGGGGGSRGWGCGQAWAVDVTPVSPFLSRRTPLRSNLLFLSCLALKNGGFGS